MCILYIKKKGNEGIEGSLMSSIIQDDEKSEAKYHINIMSSVIVQGVKSRFQWIYSLIYIFGLDLLLPYLASLKFRILN